MVITILEKDYLYTDCYSTGSVEGNQFVGGLVGRKDGGEIASSYWDTETSGQSESAGGVGKTTVEMQQESTFGGWDFSSIWGIDGSYPYLLDNE